MRKLKKNLQLLKDALSDLNEHNPLQLASSTAFFCLFALPPILIIFITIVSIFVSPDALSGEIFNQIAAMLGDSGAEQIREIYENFQSLAEDPLPSILAFLFFIFISTNLFVLVRKNLNQLWNIRVVEKPNFLIVVKNRSLALSLILIGGVLILLSLLSDAMVTFLGDILDQIMPNLGLPLIWVISTAFSIFTITIWFTILYQILPNAKIEWRPAFVGGFTTALLFTVGKIVMGQVLVNSDLDNIFGAAGSIILILLFVFYSSLIFYFGAAFTKTYSDDINQPIQADEISESTES